MTIEQKLQEYILSKYKSIMQFAKSADLPYTTVKGIINRGIWGASVQNVNKICDILSIDINALILGEIKQKVEITNLTAHEKKIISAYREKKEMHSAVDKLLGIKDNNIYVLKATKNNSHEQFEYIKISREEMDKIKNIKCIKNEEDI